MGSALRLHPRDTGTLRNVLAAQLAAHVLPTLPVGYWQRRVAARAFALDVMPVVPRESQVQETRRLPGMPALWLVTSDAMTWGLVPWVWGGEPAPVEVHEARAACRRVWAVSRTDACAVVFVSSAPPIPRRQQIPRLRLIGSSAGTAAVGIITVEEIADVLEEAATDLGDDPGARRAAHAALRLRASVADRPTGDGGGTLATRP